MQRVQVGVYDWGVWLLFVLNGEIKQIRRLADDDIFEGDVVQSDLLFGHDQEERLGLLLFYVLNVDVAEGHDGFQLHYDLFKGRLNHG